MSQKFRCLCFATMLYYSTERIFSAGGLTVTNLRASLDEAKVEAILLVHLNLMKVDKMESLAQVVQQVPLVREDYLECLAYLAQRDIEDFQVLMELKETWESLVKKEKKVHMVRWDHQDLWDQQDPEVSEEEKVHLVRRD